MALGTVTVLRSDYAGSQRIVDALVQLTAGANYTAGGDSILPAQLGLTAIQRGTAMPEAQAATVGPSDIDIIPQVDGSAKLKSFVAAGTGENAGNANLSTITARCTFWGY